MKPKVSEYPLNEIADSRIIRLERHKEEPSTLVRDSLCFLGVMLIVCAVILCVSSVSVEIYEIYKAMERV